MRNNLKIVLLILCVSVLTHVVGQRQSKAYAMIGIGNSGSVKLSEFKAQLGVRAYGWINAVHAEPITVDSFKILAMRDTSIIIWKKNNGAAFAKEMKRLFDDLKVGDKVLAYEIYATMTKQKILISPLEYLIE